MESGNKTERLESEQHWCHTAELIYEEGDWWSEWEQSILGQKAAEFNKWDEWQMGLLSYMWTCIRLAAVPTWALQTSGDDLLYVGAVEVGLHDAVKRHVGPEDQLATVVEVQGDGVLQVVEQQGVLRAVRQNLTDVDAVGKKQHRLWT